jgi:prepilin-type N-terminal cleavage/methylation domain-containing protein
MFILQEIPSMKMKGFTLIELLIVVAIIAILAAIAVPNFLEAQVRSKVSRAHADQRSIATAQEAYFVDNNNYTEYADDSFFVTGVGKGYVRLTTPISYLASIPRDPFKNEMHPSQGMRGWEIPYKMGGSGAGKGDQTLKGYVTRSVGPDQANQMGGGWAQWPTGNVMTVKFYDPTNGTVSPGDIFRVGPKFHESKTNIQY